MADIKPAYGTKTAIPVTLTSLPNGSARETTAVDNTTDRFADALVRVRTNGQASGTGTLDVYVYSALNDTSYVDGATGADAAFTAANRRNAEFLGTIQMAATTAVSRMMPSIASVFGGVLPPKWGLIFINSSGAALSATGGDHVVEFQGVYAQSS